MKYPKTYGIRSPAAAKLPGVEEVRQVRVRRSGPDHFVDLVLAVSRSLTAGQAHEITEKVEKAVRADHSPFLRDGPRRSDSHCR